MKVAITSTGNSLEAKIDNHFGRCAFFVIYDSLSGSTEFIPNPNREKIEGAGQESARWLVSKGVTRVISGEFGTKVKSYFDRFQVQLIIIKQPEKRVVEVIELINKK